LQSIVNLRHGKTTLIITHRLFNVKIADTIVVMKAGTIVGQGSHKDLLETKGEYYKLHSRQKPRRSNHVN
jgi:subfamily B ATP-binding cassette protein MsbA